MMNPFDTKTGLNVMEDFPIYSDIIRRGDPFEDLKNLTNVDLLSCWERFDKLLDFGELATRVGHARQLFTEPTKSELLKLHEIMFAGREGAGSLRSTTVGALFKGQDCPDPRFIAQSLDNFAAWLKADSFLEIHAVEKAALVMTRLIDIWPFDFGNRSVAAVFSNYFLEKANLPPFFLLPDNLENFDLILDQAIKMQTQPLVTTIYNSMQRELNLASS